MEHSADRNALTDQRIGRRKAFKRYSVPTVCILLAVAGAIMGFDLTDIAKAIRGAIVAAFDWADIRAWLNEIGFLAWAETLGIDLAMVRRILANAVVGITFGGALNWLLNWMGLFDRLFPDPPSFVFCDLARERAETLLEVELGAPPVLVGRDSEMQDLCAMLALPVRERFMIQIITGPTGVGKSRLAIEWLAQAEAEKWDFGVIDPTRLERIKGWKARRRTALVLDEADTPGLLLQTGTASPLEGLLLNLLAASSKEKPVRILLVGQAAPWASGQVPEKLRTYVAKDPVALVLLEGEPLQQLAKELATRNGADLATIIRESSGNPRHAILMAQVPDAITLESALKDWTNRAIPELARDSVAVDPSLALGLIASAMIGPVPASRIAQTFKGFDVGPLLRFFPRGGRMRLEQGIPALRPDDWAQILALRLLDRLPMALRDEDVVPLLLDHPEALERRLGEIWRDDPHWVEGHRDYPAEGSWQASLALRLRTLQAAFDARWPDRVAALRQRMSAAVDDMGEGAALGVVHRGAQLAAAIADYRPFDEAIRLEEAKAAVRAIYHYSRAGSAGRDIAVDALERWGQRLDAIVDIAGFAADSAIRLREAKAAVHAISHYGAVGAVGQDGAFVALERWGERLAAIYRDVPALVADPTIRLLEAYAAVNAMFHYGKALVAEQEGALVAIERWGERFAAMYQAVPALVADPAIRLLEAKAADNAISDYGKAGAAGQSGAFAALERWGERFAAIYRDVPALAADPTIRLHEANAAVNAISYYGTAGAAEQSGAFAALERWGERFAAIYRDVPALAADPAIRLDEAKAAFNAIHHYGTAGAAGQDGAFSALERWGKRFAEMYRDVPALAADPAIRLEEAKAVVLAMHRYGAAGSVAGQDRAFVALERWGERFAAMYRDVPVLAADPSIRLHEAKAVLNAAHHYGTAGEAGQQGAFAALERWGKRFAAMYQDVPALAADTSIRLTEAKVAGNATYYYGKAGTGGGERASAALERWGECFAAIYQDVPALAADHAIRSHEARAVVNAISHYGTAGAAGQDRAFASLERWGKRFAEMYRDVPALAADPAIRLDEAKAAANAINHYGKVGEDQDWRRWRGRLARVAQHFPYDPEISEIAHQQNLSLAEQQSRDWPYGRYQWTKDGVQQTLQEPRGDYAEQPSDPLAPTAAPPPLVPPASRNDPCPCGSGKRYKHCHGAVSEQFGH